MGLYGNSLFAKSNIIEEASDSIINFGSIAYNEYLNYKSMLENCTDESDRFILEAKVDILCEVGIKDIWEKIKEAFRKLIKLVKDLFTKIKNFFKSKKVSMLEKEVANLKNKLNEKEKENQKLASDLKASKDDYLSTNDAYNKLMSDYKKLNNNYDSSKNKLQAERDKAEWLSDKLDEIKSKYVNLKKEDDANLARINLANLKLAKTLADLSSNPIIYFDVFDYTKGNTPRVYHLGKAMQGVKSRISHMNFHFRNKNTSIDDDEYSDYKVKQLSDEDKEYIKNVIEEVKDLSSDILTKEAKDACTSEHGYFNDVQFSILIDKKNAEKCNNCCSQFSTDATKFLDFLKGCEWASQGSMMERTLSDLNEALDETNSIIISMSNNTDTITQEVISLLSEVKKTFTTNIEISKTLSYYATRSIGAVKSSIIAIEALLATE